MNESEKIIKNINIENRERESRWKRCKQKTETNLSVSTFFSQRDYVCWVGWIWILNKHFNSINVFLYSSWQRWLYITSYHILSVIILRTNSYIYHIPFKIRLYYDVYKNYYPDVICSRPTWQTSMQHSLFLFLCCV